MVISFVGYLAVLIALSLGIYILFTNIRNSINRSLGGVVIAFSFWALCLVLYANPVIYGSEVWIRLTYVFVFPGIYLIFGLLNFPEKDKYYKIDRLYLIYTLIGSLPFLYSLFFNDWFVQEVTVVDGDIVTKHGLAYYIFLVYICPIIIYSYYRYYYRLKNLKGLLKTQTQYLIFAVLAFSFLALWFDVIIPLFFGTTAFFGLSPVSVIPLALIMIYGMARYRLIDVRLAVKYIISRILLIAIITVPLLLLIELAVSSTFNETRLVLRFAIVAIVTVGVFEKWVTRVDPGVWVARFLYKNERNREVAVSGFLRELSEVIKYSDVVDLVQNKMIRVLGIKKISISSLNENAEIYTGLSNLKSIFIAQEYKYINKSYSADDQSLRTLYEWMVYSRYDLVAPINSLSKDGTLTYLFVGEKDDQTAYSTEDIDLLQQLIYQLRISLDKIFLIEQLEADKQVIGAEKNKLALTLEGVSDAVIGLDIRRKVAVFNKVFAGLVGVEKVNLGTSIDELFVVRDNQNNEIPWEHIFPQNINPIEDELVYVLNDGFLVSYDNKIIPVSLRVSTIKEAIVSDISYIVVIWDLSEEVQLERMKLDFVAMAAHELRTPLTSIRGYLSIYMQENELHLKNDQKKVLERIQISADQLVSLVDNLLVVSQIEENTYKMNYSDIHWCKFIEDKVAMFIQQANDRGLNISYEIGPEMEDLVVIADKLRIGEVLENLIANAIKYTKEGSVLISSYYDKEKREVNTIVRDTGEGIPLEAQAHMFEKFFRVWGQLEQGSKGTGLGLYIAKAIVQMHKGRIYVKSEGEGKGAEFTFVLPINGDNSQ